MTLSAADREAIAARNSLNPTEDFLVSNALDHLRGNAKRLGVHLATDDRCAALEAALVRFMIASRPSIPSTPVKYQTANYTVRFNPETNTGDFEHNTRAGYASGNLLFETNDNNVVELIEYDGVTALPKEVLAFLQNQGFNVDGIDEDLP